MIKFFFKLNLNKFQKEEFEKIINNYYLDLKEYRKNDLKWLFAIQYGSICSFYMDVLFFDQGITFFFGFAIVPFLSSIFFTYKIYKKENFFLANYNFGSCSLKAKVFIYFSLYAKCTYSLFIGLILIGGISLTNGMIKEIFDYNCLREFGMYTGLHLESPVSIWNKSDKLK